ncbi:hypothetical protein HDV05_000839 [Chytridiales sp. JEL 0842]|nr:hypothetical protein HDV05_000839 [Chytridiales sp. JEL 0842]
MSHSPKRQETADTAVDDAELKYKHESVNDSHEPTLKESMDSLNTKTDTLIASVANIQNLLNESSGVTLCEDAITLSVQGTIFVLKLEFVLSHDWMIAKIVTSDVPFTSVNGLVYLDVDAASFRLIVAILKCIATVAEVAPKLSGVELSLLIATARYLHCTDIAEDLQRVKSGHERELENEKNENNRLQEEIKAHQEEIKALTEKAKWLSLLGK